MKQFVLILDEVWENKVEDSPPYHAWWDSRQKRFNQICAVATMRAADSAVQSGTITLEDNIMEREAGRYLADVFARPAEIIDAMGISDNQDLADVAVGYDTDVYPLAVALVDRYGITDNEDRE